MRPSCPSRRQPLRATSLLAAVACGAALFLFSPQANAQFTNRSIGFGLGYLGFEQRLRMGSGPQLGLEMTIYIDAGFEVYMRPWAMLATEGAAPNATVIGFGSPIGIRYLFSEDGLRPYAGLNLMPIWFPESTVLPDVMIGANPTAGVEYYFGENAAVGLQVEYSRIIALNAPDGSAFGATARILWGF